MKYVKLFENFEEHPKSIVIETTPKFDEKMREYVNATTRDRGFSSLNSKIELFNDGNEFNYVKVGTIPFDIGSNNQQMYWASYHPEANEIYVSMSATSAEETQRLEDVAGRDGILYNHQIDRLFKGKFNPGFYCKFENGFNVGEEDHRGYFKIVSVKNELEEITENLSADLNKETILHIVKLKIEEELQLAEEEFDKGRLSAKAAAKKPFFNGKIEAYEEVLGIISKFEKDS